MSYYVCLMRKEDCDQVTEIDREAFPSIWPPVNYKRELENLLAHYIVACDSEKKVKEVYAANPSGKGLSVVLTRIRRRLNLERMPKYETAPVTRDYIVGFSGFWMMADEAHITSIAVRVSYMRRGIGELLLISTIALAKELKAKIITLEVRASNIAAHRLYYKYGFIRAGVRPRYYLDNKEDAIIMSTEDINSEAFQALFQRLKEAYLKKWGISPDQI